MVETGHGLEVGVAKVEITAFEPNLGMMGWGMLGNVVRSQATPLHARAFVLRSAERGTKLAIVVCDLVFITLALREAIAEQLAKAHPETGLQLQQIMVLATHTHSGPGGYTHYPFYNVTIPGFAPRVLATLAERTAAAIAQADARRVPAVARYGESEFSEDAEVAFNRSIAAYNANPDTVPVVPDRPAAALDRTMRLLRFDARDGKPLGSINWFAVHCTNVHSDNTALHFDNKGYAAQFVEEQYAQRGATDYVAAFAQGASGDVTPNFQRHPGRPWVRGKYPDDDESARFNGRLQADKALEIIEACHTSTPLPLRLGVAHAFVDMSDVEVDPRFVGGREGCRTGPAELGMSMFFGTEEGPGLPRQLLFLQDLAASVRPWWRRVRASLPGTPDYADRDATQAEKITWLESARHRILGLRGLGALPLPWNLHPALQQVHLMANADEAIPWTPHVLPVQLFVVGNRAIAAVPQEFTTVSGRRLRAAVTGELAERKIVDTIVAGYANAYAGYVTTPEEYAYQEYEGASTHFGKWTLPAYQTLFARLARDLVQGEQQPWPERAPPRFDAQELAARSFGG